MSVLYDFMIIFFRKFPQFHTCKCQVPSDRGRGGWGWPAPALRQKGVHHQEAAGGRGSGQPRQGREWGGGGRGYRGQSAEQPPGLPRPGPDLRPPASRGKQKFREQYQQLFPAARDHARWEPGAYSGGWNKKLDLAKIDTICTNVSVIKPRCTISKLQW